MVECAGSILKWSMKSIDEVEQVICLECISHFSLSITLAQIKGPFLKKLITSKEQIDFNLLPKS